MKIIRQKFIDIFHDKTPFRISKVVPGKDVFFFNAYSFIDTLYDHISFDLNDADAVPLVNIQDEGLVTSIVGEIQFTGPEILQSYFKDGRNRQDRMREGIFSDGTKTVQITVWSDMLDMIKENELIQISSSSSRIFNEEVVN